MLRRAALRYIKAWGHREYTVMGILLLQPEGKSPPSEWMYLGNGSWSSLFVHKPGMMHCHLHHVSVGRPAGHICLSRAQTVCLDEGDEDKCFPGAEVREVLFLFFNFKSQFSFQKDVLELAFCQASSKVFYLTRRGYGIDLSTRYTFQEKN